MHVVTGAFSFTGSYVARALLRRGEPVRTLSRRPDDGHPLAHQVEFARLQFEDEVALTADLRGAETLFNTYWVRYPRGTTTWASVLENTRALLRAAARAGVRKIVQFSVSNASEASPYGYFRAKALAERELRDSGLPYAILKPTLVFGRGELLLSNIAWTLRRSPVFLVPTGGRYAVQPVSVEEVAELALGLASGDDGAEIDAAGSDVYSFAELVEAVRSAIGARSRIVRCPPTAVLAAARAGSLLSGDTLVGREELAALRDDLLVSSEPPRAKARLEDWLAEQGATLGRSFVSERERNWY